ncbi:MAG TPA: deoxyribodipyrimidine photo-lyase [Anaerolineaceae bacterium]
MITAIWWIRRDLRLADNPALREALQAALGDGGHLLPVFILDPVLLATAGPHKQAFLFDGLRRLDESLRTRGSRLVLRDARRSGGVLPALAALAAETGTQVIFAGEDHTPYARRRDNLAASRLPLRLAADGTIFPPGWVHKPGGAPYTVYTPYKNAWKALPFPAPVDNPLPSHFPPCPDVPSEPFPAEAKPDATLFPAGEEQASLRLERFLAGPVYAYAEGRNRLDQPGTSTLSPYLHLGMLSARRAYAAGLKALAAIPSGLAGEEARRGCQVWLDELIWREFYASILFHFPEVAKQAFNPRLRQVAWNADPAGFSAWQEGRTGYPVVDAAMRALAQTGWMHNRARMITASFLVKDLLINWQEGERWFMTCLVDGDLASNNGGWQWTAGVGTDAAPYFRVFNPVLQSQKFDPSGSFLRAWLPELADVPLEYLHAPWLMPKAEQSAARCRIGSDYPAPLIDHAFAKERALEAFKRAGG